MGKPSSSRREPTQMLDAQRVKRSMEAHSKTTPPASKSIESATITISPYSVHNKPTIPINLRERQGMGSRSAANPFEKESPSGHADAPSTAQILSNQRLLDPDLLLQDSSSLLMHREPLDTATSWTIAPFACAPEKILVAWLQGTSLNLRDEHGKHHVIDLSKRIVTAMHHDATFTWFGTSRGHLFCFDRKQNKLTLAHEVPHNERITLILSLPEQDRLCIATKTGKLYTSSLSKPTKLNRQGRTLTQGILTGTWSPKNEELLLVTGNHTIERISLHPGIPPKGGAIAPGCEASAIFAHPTQPLLYIHDKNSAELHLYKLEQRSKRVCTARLPSSSCCTYLAREEPHARLIYARGNVLFHANVL